MNEIGLDPALIKGQIQKSSTIRMTGPLRDRAHFVVVSPCSYTGDEGALLEYLPYIGVDHNADLSWLLLAFEDGDTEWFQRHELRLSKAAKWPAKTP